MCGTATGLIFKTPPMIVKLHLSQVLITYAAITVVEDRTIIFTTTYENMPRDLAY